MGHSRVLSVLKCSNTCERPPDICARLSCAHPPHSPPPNLARCAPAATPLGRHQVPLTMQEHETPGLAEFLQDRDLSRKIA